MVFDASELDAPMGPMVVRLLPAIAALFDEDDTNPRHPQQAKERLLFKKAPPCVSA